ncbi:MAG TPA: Flp family type IVb pilin [Alphaproteobacteria bacterium]|nr:Flp family type IVb pilin [Alphaproteobacteria bacterium]
MTPATAFVRALASSERGATALEYALIAAIIGVVTVGAMHGVGTSLLYNFKTLVAAVSGGSEPQGPGDTGPPTPPAPSAESPGSAPTPSQAVMGDESSGVPETTEADETAEEALARAVPPIGPEAGIEPSGPAIGPDDGTVPMAALSSPAERLETFGRDHSTTIPLSPVPPGRESSGDGAQSWRAEEALRVSSQAQSTGDDAESTGLTQRQKAALRSGFILFLWLAFFVGLVNLIWRIVTRKAYEKEVEDQLQGWQPASFS